MRIAEFTKPKSPSIKNASPKAGQIEAVAYVWIYERQEKRSPSGAAAELAKSLGSLGLTGSVTNLADLQRFVDQTMQQYGRIDAVVNHTGHSPKGDLLKIPDEDWHTGLDLAMLNVVRMARLVTPIMQKQSGGAIANMSTFAVFEPEATFPVSVAMRAALAGFTKLYAEFEEPCVQRTLEEHC